MNIQLNNTLLARIYGERIGQQIKYFYIEDEEKSSYGTIEGVCENNSGVDILVKYANGNSNAYPSYDCQLLLIPLDKINNEDAKKLCEILNIEYSNDVNSERYFDLAGIQSEIKELIWDNYGHKGIVSAYVFLKQMGYDIPMFFGIDHPDNGRTLIELGIAIDKTTI